LTGACAREQAPERSVKNAQLGLGRRRPVAARVVRCARVIVVGVRGEKVVEVPHRVRQRTQLRAEQQERAGEM